MVIEHDPTREAFLTKPLGGLILKNALPAVASMLFMAFYHIAYFFRKTIQKLPGLRFGFPGGVTTFLYNRALLSHLGSDPARG